MSKQLFIWVSALIIITAFWPSSTTISAQPSVETCLENPALEGCGDYGSSKDVEEEEQSIPSSSPASSEGSMLLDLIKLILALAFIIFLIYILLKFMNKRNKSIHPSKAMENLGGVPLGQNKSLQIVRIGQQVYAVGVGENVELVTEIKDEHTINELTKKKEPDVQSFSPSFIKQLLPQKKASGKDEEKSYNDQSFQKLFQTELSSLKERRKQLVEAEKRKKEDSNE
ncbi:MULTISPECIES: flagellar biosynthetic protein FliO [Pontibacillus]|uniref:Flagellar biosynthetic protein FliO n=1 Tax=Pontibacillus chungwhensis TaxID=265426 RepID=A0ABY8V805_9BACI|nr:MULTISPECIES: flagellar biosynthetic protein FliO [Pontibacillus]MCD5322695.1 flagellar biosynthetic protein FliO [Pontibacillus sp. HN14]WIF99971.1 flagellar biosynthetic protein FliO [Pontibacillus chungwhensis]